MIENNKITTTEIKHSNGKVMFSIVKKNGLNHGISIAWCSDGTYWYQSTWKKNITQGVLVTFCYLK